MSKRRYNMISQEEEDERFAYAPPVRQGPLLQKEQPRMKPNPDTGARFREIQNQINLWGMKYIDSL